MSSKLAPSKSTVYMSNLKFSLTNNDLHKIFDKFGKIARITIAKDSETRKSKGVAFIQFVTEDSACSAIREFNQKLLYGRTVTCSIAKDNGRTPEFITKRYYTDKSRCYECGQPGHISYVCSKNLLGVRKPPVKKPKNIKTLHKIEENYKKNNYQQNEHAPNNDDDIDMYDHSLKDAINELKK